MIKAVIFDFDGVLHNTFEFHRNKVTEFTGKDLTADELKDMHNGNVFQNSPEKLKGVDWKRYEKFIQPEQSRLIILPEIRQMIDALSNFRLFIVSSSGEPNMIALLKNNKMLDYFTDILGYHSHTSKVEKFKMIFEKYSLTSEECIFITDTLGDILEANLVNLKTIAVDFGYHDKETLKRGNPMKIVSHPKEIIELLK